MTPYERYLYYLSTLENPVMDSTVVNSEENPLKNLLIQSQEGNGQNDNVGPITNPNNAGIYSIQDAMNFMKNLPTPMNLARRALEGIGNLINNYQNPYTNIMGNLNQQTQDAIARDIARDMQAANQANKTGGYGAGYDSDFMEGPGGGRDAAQESTSPGSSGPGGSDTMGSS